MPLSSLDRHKRKLPLTPRVKSDKDPIERLEDAEDKLLMERQHDVIPFKDVSQELRAAEGQEHPT